jgi:D-alanyl-D-alanine carboxypeptidase/D-alanyl-D-alanine-endopeptidase (penicillin-binding protein 4)
VKGKLYAKTGYIHGVSCLSGYVVKDGKVATFSVLVNGIGASARAAKRLQEAVGELIYSRL